MNTLVDQSVAIIIPMHNEAENVMPVINEICMTLDGKITFAIIAVDDGSSDSTLRCLQELQQTVPQLKIVRHRHKSGQSASVVTGVQAAPFEWIVTLDGDGQNHPDDILKLLQVMQQAQANQDRPILVAGNRCARRDTWIRLLSSRIANSVRRLMLRDDCPDSGCGIKAFKRSDFLKLPYFDHLHRFLPALFKRNGGEIINIPVQHRSRAHGRSKYGINNRLWIGIVDLFGVSWLIRRPCRPEIDDHVA